MSMAEQERGAGLVALRGQAEERHGESRAAAPRRVADGLWGEVLQAGPEGTVCEYNFWVDFRLDLPGAPETAGIIWTDNGGANWHVVTAAKFADLPDGGQMWGVSVRPCGDAFLQREPGLVSWYPVGMPRPSKIEEGRVRIQYAIFCRAGGACHWDNNHGKNYGFVIGEQV